LGDPEGVDVVGCSIARAGDVVDPKRGRALFEETANLVFHVAENDDQPLEAPLLETADLPFQDRDASYLREALGRVMGQGLQASSGSGSEQQCGPHAVSVM